MQPKDRQRSIPLDQLRPLLGLDVEFHALQKEMRDADREIAGNFSNLFFWGESLLDFSDTAALAQEMDIAICVDTGPAHVAAAVGAPTWILLPATPDWRWMLGREDSPWYPTVRLFRQPARGDWESVITRVREALCAMH